MKINNLNVLEKVQGFVRPPEENLIEIYLSYEDVQALNRLKSRWNLYGKPDPNGEAIRRAIGERHSIKELTLSKTGRHNNQGTVWLEKDVRKTLIKEANDEGLKPAEYIRGIIYSLNQKLAHEEIAERKSRAKIKHDNRVLSFSTYVQPELREVLYKKYGRLSDKELMKAVEKDTVEWLSTLK
ncbi:hypothetical protein [Alkalihalobacterium elongatum]|uniref:hypothetical protein n=1 Tax=Alkalihalobacterium elongatum TaxID=2675466 RepID=UPI001C1F6010|nr:hypothetical protein [Alkalihalobacterium elongatum]